jgi:hypothetical protein
MKRFKEIDLVLQVSILFLSAVAIMPYKEYALIGFYLVLGGWQLVSAIVHQATGFFRSGARRLYTYLCYVLVLLLGFSFTAMPFGIFFLYFMVVAGPLMAIYYLVICFTEYRFLKRPSDLI